MDQQKPKIQTNIDDNEEVRGNSSHESARMSTGVQATIWQMKVFQNTETLSVLLMNYLQSREHKVVSGMHSIFTQLPKDRNCKICLRAKITKASCRKRTGTAVPRA